MSFKSLYTTSNYVVPIDARTSISLNGIDLRSFGFELTSMPDLSLPPVRQRNTTIDGRSGSIAMGDLYENWSFDITGQLVGQSLEDAISKKDNLLKWIDIEQMNMTKFVIGEKEYYGMNFELAGAPLFYSNGTISVTINNKTITGANTKFTNYVKPGVTFEVAGDTKIYTVESVTDDDTLTLTETVERTSGSTLSYRIERKRYLIVQYNGNSSISPVSNRGFLRQSDVGDTNNHVAFNLTIGFYTTYPYWIGDIFDDDIGVVDASSGAFVKLEGIGNAPVSPKYVFEGLTGEVANPEITSGECSFYSNFDISQKARTIKNDADVSPATPLTSPTFKSSKDGYAIDLQVSEKITYKSASSVSGHNEEGSFLARFDGSDMVSSSNTGNRTIFKWSVQETASPTNYIELYTEEDTVCLRSSNTSYANATIISVSTTAHHASYVELSGWWNWNGVTDEKDSVTYYAKLLMNGEIIGSITSLPNSRYNASETGALSQLLLGGGNDSDEISLAELMLFNRALSDEKLRSLTYSTQKLSNDNRTMKYTGTVSASDIFLYDAMTGDSELFDSSVGAKINSVSGISGRPPVLVGDDINENTMLYLKTDGNNASTKFHVIYRPHFR